MTKDTENYMESAQSDACDMAMHFLDEIMEMLISDGEVDEYEIDVHDYNHEYHVDRSYSLTEADELLDTLSDYEETDYGLWDRLPPREAISAQAAYTYGNAVMQMWYGILENINEDRVLKDALQDLQTAEEETGESTYWRKVVEQMVMGIIKGEQ